MGKRSNGEGTVHKLADGRWRATIELGTGADGKRRRRSRIASRRADAVALLREMLNERDAGIAYLSSSPKLSEFLAQWIESLSRRSAKNTTSLYRNAIDTHINPLIGGVRIDKLTPVQIVGMLNDWHRMGVGVRSQQVGLSVVSNALGEASKLGMIRSNPAANVKPPKLARKNIDPFTREEIQSILAAAESFPLLRPGIVLLFSTGMRFGEMSGLPWRCVDLNAGTIRIEQQVTTDAGTGKSSIEAVKTSRSNRTLEMPDIALNALTDHRALTMKLGKAGDDLVFLGNRGGFITNRNFTARVWKPILEAANVRKRPPHHARHTYATLTLSAGVPVHVVSAILGHARASITLDTYAHYIPSQQSKANETINSLIG